MKKTKTHVRICPKCNSKDISTDFSNAGLVGTGLFQDSFKCNHCGNTGRFFPEVEINKVHHIKKVKDVEKRDLIDKTIGKNISWWWRIAGPLTLILSFIFMFSKIKTLFFTGLLVFLPFSLTLIFATYQKKLLEKYKILRIISIIIFIYSFTVGIVLAIYLSN